MPYGRLLKEPDFTDGPGYERRAAELPRFEKLPLYVDAPPVPVPEGQDRLATPPAAERRLYERRMGVLNTLSRKVVADVEPGFAIVQHREVSDAVMHAARDAAATFKGGFFISEDGSRSMGVLCLLDRGGFNVAPPGARKGEAFRAGVEWANSLDGSGSVSISGFVERVVCSNGRVAASVLGHVAASHSNGVAQFLADLPRHAAELIGKAQGYARVWQEADAEEVRMMDVPLLLKGAGLPDKGIASVVANMHKYEPLTRERLTRATLHEAANYWLNHESKLGWERARGLTGKVHVLMETNVEKLLDAVAPRA